MSAKEILVATVILTAGVALFQKTVPYFPIEISRTASHGFAAPIFATGCFLASSVLIHENGPHLSIFLIIMGLMILALFGDLVFWKTHMFGVCVMMFGVFLRFIEHIAVGNDPQTAALIMGLAISIYLLRIVEKAIVIILFEMGEPFFFFVGSPLKTLSVLKRAFGEGKRIMYYGNPKSPVTLWIFRAAGIQQWLVFVLMSVFFK